MSHNICTISMAVAMLFLQRDPPPLRRTWPEGNFKIFVQRTCKVAQQLDPPKEIELLCHPALQQHATTTTTTAFMIKDLLRKKIVQ